MIKGAWREELDAASVPQQSNSLRGRRPASAVWTFGVGSILIALAAFLATLTISWQFELRKVYQIHMGEGDGLGLETVLLAAATSVAAVLIRCGFVWASRNAELLKEAELASMARVDRLTGLDSRAWAEVLLAKLDAHNLRFCAIVDARRFSEINSCFGYALGDDILKDVAQRLRGAVPSAHVLARINSDVFVVISQILANEAEGREIVEVMHQRLLQPFHKELDLLIGFSIGVTFTTDATAVECDIMQRADIALHSGDGNPEGGVIYFKDSMLESIRRRRMVEINLRKAINSDTVVPYLQPIIDVANGKLAGFEVLARWTDHDLGTVHPTEFIPVAEASGLIGKLDEQLLAVACRRAAGWPGQLKLSVNLAANALNEPTTALRILATLGSTRFPSSRLQIEVTESEQLHRSHTTETCIAALRQAGVRVVIDDFGTGYCSFERLVGNRFDGLKIDRSFVQGMEFNADMAAIVLASISIGKRLGLTVTAEGVETEEQFTALRAMGCDRAQGYHFGRPMTLSDAHLLALGKFPPVEEIATDAVA